MQKSPYDFVLDCSVTMAWCFEDESTRETDAILDSLETAEAIVPNLWPLEVANVLLQAKKRKRISEMGVADFLDALSVLPITIDPTTTSRAMHSIFVLAQELNLTIYDAAYLELAKREGIPLLTLDKGLIKAAETLQLPKLPHVLLSHSASLT